MWNEHKCRINFLVYLYLIEANCKSIEDCKGRFTEQTEAWAVLPQMNILEPK